MLRVLGSTCLLALCLSAPLSAQSYGVRPGDRIAIEFFTAAGDAIEEITGERSVDRDGSLFLPFVGTVEVEGLDAVEVRLLLSDLYENVYPDAVIEVDVSLRVSVTGAVPRPGVYYLDPSTTALQAIAEAGGGQDRQGSQGTLRSPNYSSIRLVRDGSVASLDLDPDSPNQVDLATPIQSGDWYHVPVTSSTRSLRDNVSFWSQLASLALTIVILANNVGGS